jgi:hypothetical protein
MSFLRASRRAPRALLSMRAVLDGIKKCPHPEEAAPGPRVARPEDRLGGCLEGRTAPIQDTLRTRYGMALPESHG